MGSVFHFLMKQTNLTRNSVNMGVKKDTSLAFYIALWQNSLRFHQNGEELFILKPIMVPMVERKAKPTFKRVSSGLVFRGLYQNQILLT